MTKSVEESKRLYLLDAYALIFRAYYAFIRNPRINSKGLNTSAIFGFVNTLLDILQQHDPSHIAVVFDHKSPSFRVKEYPLYKANRQETPEDIQKAEPWIRKIIQALRIPILEAEGYEADDVIATLAKKAQEKGYEVFMVTPDKDFMQVLDRHIAMYKPSRGGDPPEIIDVEKFREKYGLESPRQFIDVLALMGDSSDNIPGVKGVGEKTAVKLIREFGSLENLYANIDKVKGKLREKLLQDKENAFLSKKLATILYDAPVPFDPDALVRSEPDNESLRKIFEELEFRSLLRRLFDDTEEPVIAPSVQGELFGAAAEQGDGDRRKQYDGKTQQYLLVEDVDRLQEVLDALSEVEEVAFDTETTGLDPLRSKLIAVSLSAEPHRAYAVLLPAEGASRRRMLELLQQFFTRRSILKIAHNAKFDVKALQWAGVDVRGPYYDTMIAHFLAEPEQRHRLDDLAKNYLHYTPISIESLIGKRGPKQRSMETVEPQMLGIYAAEDADLTLQLKPILDRMLEQREQRSIFEKIEMPLMPVLARMELKGVAVDVPFLKAYSEELEREMLQIREQIYQLAGMEFNLDSPRQVGAVLFEQLKIPYTRPKTKTGQYSTREEVLRKLKDKHPIIPLILEYREIAKLKSTYVDALPELVHPETGRIHTTFNQTIAITGRLSSTNPNLQNIPIRTERGRRIRQAFVAGGESSVLLSADYSQIELRLLAHMSEDENMIRAFQQGRDIHRATAARIFKVDEEAVTPEMRRIAKAVNFGIAYGQSAFGLSQTLEISRKEASEIIRQYYEEFPGIKKYMERIIRYAREHGYVETLLGRRRYLRDIHSRNDTVRKAAERNAINSPIQGSAADLIKLAMIEIDNLLQTKHPNAHMLLQVHDELLFEVPKGDLESVQTLVRSTMENALQLKVPLVVDIGVGKNWLEAH